MKVRDVRSRHILGCVENGSIISLGIEKKATPDVYKRQAILCADLEIVFINANFFIIRSPF